MSGFDGCPCSNAHHAAGETGVETVGDGLAVDSRGVNPRVCGCFSITLIERKVGRRIVHGIYLRYFTAPSGVAGSATIP